MSEFNKQKYDNEYAKNNYDRCIFNVPKGQKKVIENHWKKKGYKSLNTYVNELIRKDMNEIEEKSSTNRIETSGENNKVIVGNINIDNGNLNM